MGYFKALIDQTFRKKRFTKEILKGINNELEDAMAYANAVIEFHTEYIDNTNSIWSGRLKKVESKTKELKELGYESVDAYFSSCDIDDKALDIIEVINANMVTSDHVERYNKSIEEDQEEINTAFQVINAIELMLKDFETYAPNSYEEVVQRFNQNKCGFLLNSKVFVDFDKVYKKYGE